MCRALVANIRVRGLHVSVCEQTDMVEGGRAWVDQWSWVHKALLVGKQPQDKSQRFLGNRSIMKSNVRLVHVVSLKLCSEGQFYA